jgi:hypothetical protein
MKFSLFYTLALALLAAGIAVAQPISTKDVLGRPVKPVKVPSGKVVVREAEHRQKNILSLHVGAIFRTKLKNPLLKLYYVMFFRLIWAHTTWHYTSHDWNQIRVDDV